jgi:hypothetical protein
MFRFYTVPTILSSWSPRRMRGGPGRNDEAHRRQSLFLVELADHGSFCLVSLAPEITAEAMFSSDMGLRASRGTTSTRFLGSIGRGRRILDKRGQSAEGASGRAISSSRVVYEGTGLRLESRGSGSVTPGGRVLWVDGGLARILRRTT